MIVGLVVVGGLVAASRFVGQYDIFGAEDGAQMFLITRIPRTIALVLAGAVMAMCGLVMQIAVAFDACIHLIVPFRKSPDSYRAV